MMKKESFILVHAGEAPAPEIIQLEPEHLLDGMYQAIHCDCIEIVRVQTGLLLPHGVVLVADESGWFRKQLIINRLATVWYGPCRYAYRRRTDTFPLSSASPFHSRYGLLLPP